MIRLLQGAVLGGLALIGGGVAFYKSGHMPRMPGMMPPAVLSAGFKRQNPDTNAEKTGTQAATKIVAAGEVIDTVWAGQPVGFAILTAGKHVFVGYYDANRQLTVAQREAAGGPWTYRRLDTHVGWDSHNYIVMTTDAGGRLHVAANMHASPLIYYMSDTSGTVDTLRRVPLLVDRRVEQRMTYPVFLHNARQQLIFKYRDGRSGNGNEIYDIFDDETATWSHLTKVPIADGQGKRNAYFAGPIFGPDGYFHLDWVWRDTPMAETNHDLSYARSPDLIHWEKADGTPLKLPLTLMNSEIVDPVPSGGGIINGNTPLGLDAQKRVVIAYHKYDSQGNTQVYVARWEGTKWHIAQASDWKNYRWNFKGGGTLKGEISMGRPRQEGDQLILPIARLGKNTELRLNANDLSQIGEFAVAEAQDITIAAAVNPAAGMILHQASASNNGEKFTIGWATQPSNRDQPAATIPKPGPLVLFKASLEGAKSQG